MNTGSGRRAPAGRIRAGLVLAGLTAVTSLASAWLAGRGPLPQAPTAGLAYAQSATRLSLDRGDTLIEIVNEGRAADGARSILDLAGCVPGEAVRSSYFYAPEGGATTRIAQPGGGTPAMVTAPLVTVLRPERAEESNDGGEQDGEGNGEQGGDEETIEAMDATAGFGRPPCLENVEEAENPDVQLVQGRTTVVGGHFRLDRGSRVATMDGPVALTRAPEGDGAPVEATADGLRFDLDDERATLSGTVRVEAGSRVSEAEELELDEAAGLATLRGSPAISRDGSDEVRGARLLYDLETNDVVVEGGVEASFEFEDGAADGPDASGGDGGSDALNGEVDGGAP